MSEARPARALRIAAACPGVGLSQRGFERMFGDMFALLKDDLDITLFKGGGSTSAREIVPSFLPRNGRAVRMLPVHRLIGRTPIHVECLTFALGLLPHLREGRYDVVHCIDPPLTRILYKLRRVFRLDFRLLYTHGVTMPPSGYPPAEFVHQVAQRAHEEAAAAGVRTDRMALVPCGIYPERFECRHSKEALRVHYGVPADTFVILSVAALNRTHKRIHHLIDEVARLEGNYLLWLDASMDQGEPDLVDYARARLGQRCRITHVRSDQVGDLYGLADVLAHASVFESFGLAIVEAASSGLPVLCHDDPHFRWLLPNPRSWVDMAAPGALARRLGQLMREPAALWDMRASFEVRQRFSWHDLRAGYEDLYRRTAAFPVTGGAMSASNYFIKLHG